MPLRHLPAHLERNRDWCGNGEGGGRMNELLDQLEAERYELFEGPAYHFNFNRRQFLKAFSGGIALIVPMSNLVAHTLQQKQGGSGRKRSNEVVPDAIGAWIHIDESGTVSAFTGKVEIGQNIRTSLAQAVADELHVPMNEVRLVVDGKCSS